MSDKPDKNTDWNLATWEGSQCESLRRWAKLPLEKIIAALEEMQELNDALHGSSASPTKSQSGGNNVLFCNLLFCRAGLAGG